MNHTHLIVTIDGPAGSGKSTAARRLAERLGFQFLDTGAMYRAVAVMCQRAQVDLHAASAVAELACRLRIHFESDRVLVDGQDLTSAIRTAEASEGSSVVAANPDVRVCMGRLQREAARDADLVTEGRDQGTDVFPDAQCKFFLVADPHQRALRRHREMRDQGDETSFEEILQQIRDRDERDANRAVAPLRVAEDAMVLDTSEMSIDEVVTTLEEHVRERMRCRQESS